jgi:hypothetical protein
MVGGGPGKIQQLFANKVFKGSLKPEPCPDRLGRLMEFALRHGASNPIGISGCVATAIPPASTSAVGQTRFERQWLQLFSDQRAPPASCRD